MLASCCVVVALIKSGITLWEMYTSRRVFEGIPRALLGHQITKVRAERPALLTCLLCCLFIRVATRGERRSLLLPAEMLK